MHLISRPVGDPPPYTAGHGPSNDQPVPPTDSVAELVVSIPAAEELEDDSLSILDIENIVLTGQITERQRDAQTREVKCVVAGVTLGGSAAEVVVKVGFGGKLVVITVYPC